MKDRINTILQKYNITPSDFADKIGVGKSNISHILGGRNNPSLEIVKKILTEFLDINAEWLLFGTGHMLKSTESVNATINIDKEPQLQFKDESNNVESEHLPNVNSKITDSIATESDMASIKSVELEPVTKILSPSIENKVVTKIVLYYSNNTYEQFDRNNLPL